ncbi:MAG: HugZ family protein [Nitratireductor sp.]
MSKNEKINAIRETNDEARALATRLMCEAVYGSIAVIDPDTSYPVVSRIAVGVMPSHSKTVPVMPMFLASDLSGHSKALVVDPRASVMFGEPKYTDKGVKGDALTYARVTMIGDVEKITRSHESYAARREFWLQKHPKSQLYIDFGDFNFYQLSVQKVALNGGFGKAFEMSGEDLLLS